MIGITLTTDQIRNAPTPVRQWIEQQVIASLGLAPETPAEHPQAAHVVACTTEEAAAVLAEIKGLMPAFNVFFEFARPRHFVRTAPGDGVPPDRHPLSHAP